MRGSEPVIDGRARDALLAELQRTAPGFVPEWTELESDSRGLGAALATSFAHLMEQVTSRVEKRPNRDFFAFLDLVGLGHVPASPARAALAFTRTPKFNGHVRVPAGSQVTGDPGDGGEVVPFATLTDLDLLRGKLASLASVDPLRDELRLPPLGFLDPGEAQPRGRRAVTTSFTDAGGRVLQLDQALDLAAGHVLRVVGSEPTIRLLVASSDGDLVTLDAPLEASIAEGVELEAVVDFEPFDGLDHQEHALVLGHETVLSLEEAAVITVEVDVAPSPGGDATRIDLVWEAYGESGDDSGAIWRPLVVVDDSTDGFLSSGVVRLFKTAFEMAAFESHGAELPSIRARVAGPIVAGSRLPRIEHVLLRTRSSSGASVKADFGLHQSNALPIQIGFEPFGPIPRRLDSFYIGSDEVLSKAGAQIELNCEVPAGVGSAPFATIDEADSSSAFFVGAGGILNHLRVDAGPPVTQRFIGLGRPPSGFLNAESPCAAVRLNSTWALAIARTTNGNFWFRTVRFDGTDGGTWFDLGKPAVDVGSKEPPRLARPGGQPAVLVVRDTNGQLHQRLATTGATDWVQLDPPAGSDAIFAYDVQGDGSSARWGVFAATRADGAAMSRVHWREDDSAWIDGGVAEVEVTTPLVAVDGGSVVSLAFVDAANLVRRGSVAGGAVNWDPPAATPTVAALLAIVHRSVDGSAPAESRIIAQRDDDAVTVIDFTDGSESDDLAVPVTADGALAGALSADASTLVDTSGTVFDVDPSGVIHWQRLRIELESVATELEPRRLIRTPSGTFTGETLHVVDSQGDRAFLEVGDHADQSNVGIGVLEADWPGAVAPQAIAARISVPTDGSSIKVLAITVASGKITACELEVADFSATAADTYGLRKGASKPWTIQNATPVDDGLTTERLSVEFDPTIDVADLAIGDTVDIVTRSGAAFAVTRGGADLCTLVVNTQGVAVGDTVQRSMAGGSMEVREVVRYDIHTRVLEVDAPWSSELPGGTLLWFTTGAPAAAQAAFSVPPPDVAPKLSWEYWNGAAWKLVHALVDGTQNLLQSGAVRFRLPEDAASKKESGQESHWIRARLVEGHYGEETTRVVDDGNGGQVVERSTDKLFPPYIESLSLSYEMLVGVEPERCLGSNAGNTRDHVAVNRAAGVPFQPFSDLVDAAPLTSGEPSPVGRVLYVGFDVDVEDVTQGLGRGAAGILFEVEEPSRPVSDPGEFTWSALTADGWRDVDAIDDSRGTSRTGIARLFLTTPTVRAQRFGEDLHWLRAAWKGEPERSTTCRSVHANAVAALQAERVDDETLDRPDGGPDFMTQIVRRPVLTQATVPDLPEWAEPDLRIAEVIGEDERAALEPEEATPLDAEAATEAASHLALVRWRRVESLADSGPEERHYVLDPASGEVTFGDGVNGRRPEANARPVRMRRYMTGGGPRGNLAAGAIQSLATATPGLDSVANPLPAGGGSDGSDAAELRTIGPARVAHSGRAVTARDYETLAYEASRDVALARCLAATDASGAPAPGHVRLLILPRSAAPLAYPNAGLVERVLRYVRARAHVSVEAANSLSVGGPRYLEVAVTARLLTRPDAIPADVETAAQQALHDLVHPTGRGPRGSGHSFGDWLVRADLATALDRTLGVTRVETLDVATRRRAGATWERITGERIETPPDALLALTSVTFEVAIDDDLEPGRGAR